MLKRSAFACAKYFSLFVFLIMFQIAPVAAYTGEDIKSLQWPFYDPNSGSTSCADDDSGTISGSGNAEKIFNYFLSKGLSPEQAAGVYGNIMHESGGDPQNIQDPGGRTKDPSTVSSGWGLIQWTPGSKIIDMAKQAGVDGPIYELSTQLDLIWQHMNNHPIVTKPFSLDHYKSINDAPSAVTYFEEQIEGAGSPQLPNRIRLAKEGLQKYGSNSAGDTTTGDTSTCGAAGGDNTDATGTYSLPVAKRWYTQHKDWFTKDHHDYPAADIPVPTGTKVYSMTAGKVIQAPAGGGCGQGVFIDAGGGVLFGYCHGLDGGSIEGAKTGDTVKPGQLIMHSDNTGSSTGPHLHVQIKVNGTTVCPQTLLVGIAEGNPPDIKSLPSTGCFY